jgi:hypothetical protein
LRACRVAQMDGPAPLEKGDWRHSLRRCSAGRAVSSEHQFSGEEVEERARGHDAHTLMLRKGE